MIKQTMKIKFFNEIRPLKGFSLSLPLSRASNSPLTPTSMEGILMDFNVFKGLAQSPCM